MKNRTPIILGMIVLAGLIFYWFQIRPVSIKKECWARIEKIRNSGRLGSAEFSQEEFQVKMGNQKYIDLYYKNCLREKGL